MSSNLNAITYQDSIILSWVGSKGPGDQISYNIFRDSIIIANIIDTVFIDRSISSSTYYLYEVSSVNDEGESTRTNTELVYSWPTPSFVSEFKIITIYPNPIYEKKDLTLLYSLDQDYFDTKVDLINIKGQIINTQYIHLSKRGWNREDISQLLCHNLASGLYFIRLRPTSSKSLYKKIIILN